MNNILDVVIQDLSSLNTPIGFVGSLVTIIDHIKNKNSNHIEETRNVIRKKSSEAYAQYCEHRKYRQEDLGVPLEKDILGYWETCLQRSVLPSASDMVASGIACKEEAEIIISYLMEQWMTIPDFSAWIHDILIQNHLEKSAEMLTDLPQILEAASQINAQLATQGIYNIATLLTPSYINDAKHSCNDLVIKNFFTVNNNFHTMLQVISADEDIPHKEATQAVAEHIQNGSPVIIAGNGGQGKTSLMMRAAVQWASSGHLTVWMSLSNKEVITEQAADRFFDCLLKLTPAGQSILLCIDNPFEGKESFSSLQARWPHNAKIHLIMAERANRLTLLADPSHDLLLHWFDDANLVVLQGVNQTWKYHLEEKYHTHYFAESWKRREAILKKSTSHLVKEEAINGADQLSVINKILRQYRKPNISLVELIYRTLFELKKITSKPGSIRLDWEEWSDLIHQEFGEVDSELQLYGVIAALKVFNTPLSLSLFCKYFDLNERKLRTRLCERFVPYHVEPVVYQEGTQTLQPKHDVIAELFFLFNKGKVTIDSLMLNLIEVMDENEVEEFLAYIIHKREVQKGSKNPIGKIDYWGYMQSIYSRVQKGSLNLSRDGKARLCLGILWADYPKNTSRNSPTVEAILDSIAPEIESNLLMEMLYTEWGIWAAREKKDSLAEEKFLAVKENAPKDIPSRTELGRLLSRQKGRETEAEKILREALKIKPKSLHPHTELGRLLSRQEGREAEAEKLLCEAIKLDSKHIQSRTELGRLLSRQKGREAEAEKFLHEALEIHSNDIQSRTELGRLLSRQKGREAEAEKFLREILVLDPQNIQSRTELGRLLSRQKGREAEAEKFLLEAMKINPKHLHSRTVLANLYERMNRPAEAKQLYQEICDINPNDSYGKEGLLRLK